MAKLEIGVDADGSLVISGRTMRWRSARLRFDPSGVEVTALDTTPVLLPWTAYDEVGSIFDGGDDTDGWVITASGSGSGGEGGIVVRVSGIYELESASILRRTRRSWLSRVSNSGPSLQGRSIVVLPSAFKSDYPQRATLRALCKC